MCGFCVVFQTVSSPDARAPCRERRARLHRVRNQPLLNDPFLDDDVGVLERGVEVAAGDRPVKRLVAGDVGVKLRRAGHRGLWRIDDGGQRLVVDVDRDRARRSA